MKPGGGAGWILIIINSSREALQSARITDRNEFKQIDLTHTFNYSKLVFFVVGVGVMYRGWRQSE